MHNRSRVAVTIGAVMLATAAAAVSAARHRQPAGSPAAGDAAQARQAEQIAVYRSPG